MAKLPAILWYPGDWMKAPDVRALSYAAKGLWFDMLCIMAEASPRGFLSLNATPIGPELLARLSGGTAPEVSRLLTELETAGVFSRDRKGAIYSRRMVRDEKAREKSRQFGKLGGNPKLIFPDNSPPYPPPISCPEDEDVNGIGIEDSSGGKGSERGPYGLPPELANELAADYWQLSAIPSELRTPPFVLAYVRWYVAAKQREKAPPPMSVRAALDKCAKMGIEKAIAALNNSIENNYTGIIEPKNGTSKHPPRRTPAERGHFPEPDAPLKRLN